MALGSSSARLSVNCAGEKSFFEHKAPTDFSHLNLFVRRIGHIPVSFRRLQVLRVSRVNFTHCLLAHRNSVVRLTTSPHTTEKKAGSEATTGILFFTLRFAMPLLMFLVFASHYNHLFRPIFCRTGLCCFGDAARSRTRRSLNHRRAASCNKCSEPAFGYS